MTIRVLGWPAFRDRRNPHTALLYSAMQELGATVKEFSVRRLLSGRYHVWHLHWPERYLNRPRAVHAVARSLRLLALMDAGRRRGARTVWTVHNLAAHERVHPRWERFFW